MDFALGNGSNNFYASDLTIVDAIITKAPPPQEIASIGALKDPALIGKYVKLTGKVAICDGATFLDGFFIEEPDRTAGVKVVGAADPAAVVNGDRVTVTGILAGEPGKLYIQADSVARVAGTTLAPVGTINRSANTTSGLLAKVWGNVTYVDASEVPTYFYVDDGSNLADGSGNSGIRVDTSKMADPVAVRTVISGLTAGDFVSVTGIVATDSNRLTIRPRTDVDIH